MKAFSCVADMRHPQIYPQLLWIVGTLARVRSEPPEQPCGASPDEHTVVLVDATGSP